MAEPVVEQLLGEDITKALARAHVGAVEDGKSAVLQTTTDGVKVRIFADDSPDDIRGRWAREMERAGLLFVIAPETVEAQVKAAIEVAARPFGCAYVREPEYGVTVGVVAGDSVDSVLRRLNEEFGRLVKKGEIEPKQRRPTDDEIEDLRWRRESAYRARLEIDSEHQGWRACVEAIEAEAAAAFVARKDDEARRLRDLAKRLRDAADADYTPRSREALRLSAEAESAHIDALEGAIGGGAAAPFWEQS